MMQRLIWRGVALTLVTAGVYWTVAQFKPCPCPAVARLLRSALGRAKCPAAPQEVPFQGGQPPLIVDLSAPWLKDPSALFPEDNLKLEDVIHPQPRSRDLDLIDLRMLSEVVNPARPSYEDEECEAGAVPPPESSSGPEAPRVTLVESGAEPTRYTPGCSEEDDAAWVPMPYADDAPLTGSRFPPFGVGLFRKKDSPPAEELEAVHLEEPPLYHEPDCPHTGPCPASGKKDLSKPGTPAMPRADEPLPDVGADARSALPKRHFTLKRSFKEEDEDSPAHPEVDTMEFRPTDAGAEDLFHQKRIY